MIPNTQIKKTEFHLAVFNAIQDAVLLIDNDLKILFSNRKICQALGIDAVIGLSFSQLVYLPSDIDELTKFVANLSINNPPMVTISLKGQGEPRQFSVSGSHIENSDFTALVLRDIHDQEITDTLRLHADRIEAIQHINSQISHELRSPLTAIHLNLEFMKEQLKSLVEAEEATKNIITAYAALISETVQESLDQLEYILNILSNLSDYSRLSAISAEIIKVKEVIEVTVKILRVATKMKDIAPERFILDIDNLKDVRVRMNTMWLSQVIWNLCMNAYEAVPPEGTIRLTGEVRDKSVFIRVMNHGHLPEKSLEKIFTPYFTSKKKGGLGLPIVRSILFRSCGYVWAMNEGDQVILTVQIPLCEVEEDKVDCEPSQPIVSGNHNVITEIQPTKAMETIYSTSVFEPDNKTV